VCDRGPPTLFRAPAQTGAFSDPCPYASVHPSLHARPIAKSRGERGERAIPAGQSPKTLPTGGWGACGERCGERKSKTLAKRTRKRAVGAFPQVQSHKPNPAADGRRSRRARRPKEQDVSHANHKLTGVCPVPPQLSVPIAVESGVVYLRHSVCSPIYLRQLCGAGAVDLRRRRSGTTRDRRGSRRLASDWGDGSRGGWPTNLRQPAHTRSSDSSVMGTDSSCRGEGRPGTCLPTR